MKITSEELQPMLSAHQTWLESEGKSGQKAKFYDLIFSKLDLSHVDLRGVIFLRCELKQVNFSQADLSGATINECTFKACDFTASKAIATRFYKSKGLSCIMDNAFMKGMMMSHCSWDKLQAKAVDLTGSILSKTTFKHADLSDSIWTAGKHLEVELIHCQAQRACFEQVELYDGRIIKSQMQESIFRSSKLYQSRLVKSNFQNSDFQAAVLLTANMKSSNMRGTNLREANLPALTAWNSSSTPPQFRHIAFNGVPKSIPWWKSLWQGRKKMRWSRYRSSYKPSQEMKESRAKIAQLAKEVQEIDRQFIANKKGTAQLEEYESLKQKNQKKSRSAKKNKRNKKVRKNKKRKR